MRQQNRKQDTQEFVLCAITTGACAVHFTETITDGWLCDKCTTHPLPDRASFLHAIVSPDEGSLQLAEYSLLAAAGPGRRTFVTTGGPSHHEVTEVLGTTATGVVYQRTGSSPMDRQVMLLTLPSAPPSSGGTSAAAARMAPPRNATAAPSGSSPIIHLGDGGDDDPVLACAPHDAIAGDGDSKGAGTTFTGMLSLSGEHLVCNFQGDGSLHSAGIPYVRMQSLATPAELGPLLQDNAVLKDAVEAIGVANLPSYRWVDVPAAPDAAAEFGSYRGRLLLPPGFDEESQYKVMVKVYGGPRSQAVTQRFPSFGLEMYLAGTGIIVAEVDGRGTAGRGSAFQQEVYRRLGDREVIDQLWFGQWLEQLPFVDSSGHTGLAMYGSSYGGYMTLMTLASVEEGNPFGVGVSSAPVTDWKYYDTIYTERFMGTPEDNPDGYDAGSVFARVHGLQGKPVLLAHGTGVWVGLYLGCTVPSRTECLPPTPCHARHSANTQAIS